jgi:hypothetical protein
VGFRQSCGGGGELHGSFVGSPRRSRGFRRLRMTRGMERWADGCRPYGTWFHLFGASPRFTPWALSCRPFGAGVWWFRLRLLLEILFLRDEGGVVFRRRRWWWRLVAWVLRCLRMTRCREAFSGGGDGSLLLLHFGFPAGSLGFPAGMVGVAEFGWIDLYSLLIVGA